MLTDAERRTIERIKVPQVATLCGSARAAFGPPLAAEWGHMLYLDTNVYARLAEELSPAEVRSLSTRWADLGMPLPLLSPVNILEIVQTADDLRREKLVYVVQHLCGHKLLVEPEALLVHSVAEKSPKLGAFVLTDLHCRSSLQAVWDDVRGDTAKTFIFAEQHRQAMRMHKEFNRLFHAWFRRGGDWDDWPVASFAGLDQEEMMASTQRMRTGLIEKIPAAVPSVEQIGEQVHQILTSIILVTGLTPHPDVIDAMWRELGPSAIGDKVEFAFGEGWPLFRGGLLLLATRWIAECATRKFDLGNMLDGYHLLYLQYVETFLTFDQRLLAFARGAKGDSKLPVVMDATAVIEGLTVRHR